MAIKVEQRGVGQGGVRWSGKDGSLDFIITGTTDKAAAWNALVKDGTVPDRVGTYVRVDADCEVEELSDGIWLGRAAYSIPTYSTQQQNTFSIGFDITGQAQKITQSKKTLYKIAAEDGGSPTDARDFGGAINVNSDGSIEGVDIFVPFLSYQISYTFPASRITTSYIGTLYQTVGKVNNSSFGAFGPAELLLTKVTGQRRDEFNWDLTFGFAAAATQTDIVINSPNGDVFTVPKKRGWDYMWVYYEPAEVSFGGGGGDDDEDTSPSYLQKVPKGVYVEQVYDEANYYTLGLT